MNDSMHWKILYKAAMLELDSEKINERIEAARRAIKNRSLEVKDHKNRNWVERQEILDAISSLDYWETFTARGEFRGLPVRSAARAANFDESQE
jgi:hypothetical protein